MMMDDTAAPVELPRILGQREDNGGSRRWSLRGVPPLLRLSGDKLRPAGLQALKRQAKGDEEVQ